MLSAFVIFYKLHQLINHYLKICILIKVYIHVQLNISVLFIYLLCFKCVFVFYFTFISIKMLFLLRCLLRKSVKTWKMALIDSLMRSYWSDAICFLFNKLWLLYKIKIITLQMNPDCKTIHTVEVRHISPPVYMFS